MTDERISAALRLQGLGPMLPIVPLSPTGKEALIKGWSKKGLQSESAVRKYYERDGDADVGWRMGTWLNQGGFSYTLDVDYRHSGAQALAALPEPPVTPMASTPGGLQYIFKTDVPMRSYTRPDKLELKGVGTLVKVPPAQSRWWVRSPFKYEIADCPEWLLPPPDKQRSLPVSPELNEIRKAQGLQPLVTGHLDLEGMCSLLERTQDGFRHDTLMECAGRVGVLVRKGLVPEGHAKAMLLAASVMSGRAEEKSSRDIDWCFSHGGGLSSSSSSSSSGVKERSPRRGAAPSLTVLYHSGDSRRASGRTPGRPPSLTTLSHPGAAAREVLRVFYETAVDQTRAGEEVPLRDFGDIFSVRWVAEKAGVSPMTASRSIHRLLDSGLLWKGDHEKKLQGEKQIRRTRFFKLTDIGLEAAAMLFGSPSDVYRSLNQRRNEIRSRNVRV